MLYFCWALLRKCCFSCSDVSEEYQVKKVNEVLRKEKTVNNYESHYCTYFHLPISLKTEFITWVKKVLLATNSTMGSSIIWASKIYISHQNIRNTCILQLKQFGKQTQCNKCFNAKAWCHYEISKTGTYQSNTNVNLMNANVLFKTRC